MRIAAAILLSATCFFLATECYSQDPCSTRYSPKPNEKPLTGVELAHRVLLLSPPAKWNLLTIGDVEFVLGCGTQHDADEFFAALHDKSTQVPDAIVLEVHEDVLRVAWDDGSYPNLGELWFRFDKPLAVMPHPGDKIVISGMYSSYSRVPLQINMTNASFVFSHPPTMEP